MKALFFLIMLFPAIALAQTTVTTFNSLSTASLIGTVPSGTTAADVEGWDFTVYATTADPTTEDNKVPLDEGTGSFSQTVSGLTSGTVIYYRAYATNATGTAYGDNERFTTLVVPNSNIIDFEMGISTIADSPSIASATISISDLRDGDELSVSSPTPYTAIWNATTGVLTFSGSGPVAQMQAALRRVAYYQNMSGWQNPYLCV